jgi:hypothetical protein
MDRASRQIGPWGESDFTWQRVRCSYDSPLSDSLHTSVLLLARHLPLRNVLYVATRKPGIEGVSTHWRQPTAGPGADIWTGVRILTFSWAVVPSALPRKAPCPDREGHQRMILARVACSGAIYCRASGALRRAGSPNLGPGRAAKRIGNIEERRTRGIAKRQDALHVG